MENAPFNLANAIAEWRNTLKQKGLAAEAIEELESHLTESTETLHAGGLSEREAFFTAVDRLGNPDDLSATPPSNITPQPRTGSGCMRTLGIGMLASGTLLLIGAIALIAWSFVSPRMYEGKVTLQHKRAASSSSLPHSTFIQTQFAIIGSRKTLEEVIETTELAKRWDLSKESAYERLKKQIKTEGVRGTDLIEISFYDPDPELAALIANTTAGTYQKRVDQSSPPNLRMVAIHERAEASNNTAKKSLLANLAVAVAVAVFGVLLIPTGIATWRRGI